MSVQYDLIIVGGGAAGFFTAINVAENNPELKIAILERGKEVLSKVRISGGGRCNVTHAEFVPNELSKNYPRGEKELKGPFHTFMTGDVMEWFDRRGVALKIEEDGRVFPVSDSSETIINCFLSAAKKLGVEILKNHIVKDFYQEDKEWIIQTSQTNFVTTKLMIATGSNAKIWKQLQKLGHQAIEAVPSLFTFNIKDPRITNLPGVVTNATVRVKQSKLSSEGALLITHWGMSGPAILKLSAWGAVELNAKKYDFEIVVNWLYQYSQHEVFEKLKVLKEQYAKQQTYKYAQFELPKRLWQSLVLASGIKNDTRWADTNKVQLKLLSDQLTQGVFTVKGKSTFKEEFVTAGGVDLKEVDFKTFESKKHKNLYFAGEVLNIDAITGGFNFQNAWTGAYIAAQAIVSGF
ncbi:NAD(P)/FAD-dependent oxidoreductase [Aquimarina aquimarini]|uniref:NAD(P)/FAD-dependent oxidoreductase n=1 Tax=Aquimarina aquimarini TaxID=1191734 RepID=UPI001F294F71|nr:NAD(P)/FAD-dependent oxidoreductase [Aquimarina aquimarini]